MLTIIGDPPLARDEQGNLKSRIATVFPRTQVLVTLPGIHATQRVAYVDAVNDQRQKAGRPPLNDDEQEREWAASVDLIIDTDAILIRPNPDDMGLAFEADEVLQELVSKAQIKFLHVLTRKVHDAIKRRGECWRISSLPRSPDEMKRMIANSRIGIAGRELYYYNKSSGVRLLTCEEFSRMTSMDDAALRKHLMEIKEHASGINRMGHPEIALFVPDSTFTLNDISQLDYAAMDDPHVRIAHEALAKRFRDAVAPEFLHDDPENIEWRKAMFAALVGEQDKSVSEEMMLGLSSEFFMQIEWLPGGRFEEGEVIFDSLFDEAMSDNDPQLRDLCDMKARSLIFNFIREYGDLEYINVGRVIGSLSRRGKFSGRRDVYIVSLKQRESAREIVQIIRMQKWGVRERLEQGKSLLEAMIGSEEYTEYILDRRLGCRQLGMNLPMRITSGKIAEVYSGRPDYDGTQIWSPYLQRDYIRGIATDKMPGSRFTNETFAIRFAHLLGRAAAPNIIVGRCDLDFRVIFDDGDEVIVEDPDGMPSDIIVCDHTGTFTDYLGDLQAFAKAYAEPVNRRAHLVADAGAFGRIYLDALVTRVAEIQREYRQRRRGFDCLFRQRRRDERGSFAYRWESVLNRLNRTDPQELGERIAENFCDAVRNATTRPVTVRVG